MIEFEEKRYPFDNAIEFFGSGYFLQLEALHLTFGWVFILFFSAYLFIGRAHSTLKLSIPFFSLSMFTNPAYEFFGLRVNEVFGVASVFFATALWFHTFPVKGVPGKFLLRLFAFTAVHSIVLSFFYPELIEGVVFLKSAVSLKIAILALNILIIGRHLRQHSDFNLVVMGVLACGTAALLIYLVQVCVLLFAKTLPYGTFLDAGFVGVPSFGSVSVERGHFGKFMAPLFPFFLYALMVWGWRKRFVLFVFVTLINISASSLSFFAFSSLVAMVVFRRSLVRPRALVASFAGILGVVALVIYFGEIFLAVFRKIEQLAFKGDESHGGGRSLGVFVEYLEKYPWGMGYGGSTLRIGPGLPEINAGYLAFFSQYSFAAVPILVLFAIFVSVTTTHCLRQGTIAGRAMAVGVMLSPLYFFADILWFVPTMWLVYEIAWSEGGRRHPEACHPDVKRKTA